MSASPRQPQQQQPQGRLTLGWRRTLYVAAGATACLLATPIPYGGGGALRTADYVAGAVPRGRQELSPAPSAAGKPRYPACNVAVLVHSEDLWGPLIDPLPDAVIVDGVHCVLRPLAPALPGGWAQAALDAAQRGAAGGAASFVLLLSAGLAPAAPGGLHGGAAWAAVLRPMLAAALDDPNYSAVGCAVLSAPPPHGTIVHAGTAVTSPCVIVGTDEGPCAVPQLAGERPSRAELKGGAVHDADLISGDCLLFGVGGEVTAALAALAAAGLSSLSVLPRSVLTTAAELLSTARAVRPELLALKQLMLGSRGGARDTQLRLAFTHTLEAMARLHQRGMALANVTDPPHWGWGRRITTRWLKPQMPPSLRRLHGTVDLVRRLGSREAESNVEATDRLRYAVKAIEGILKRSAGHNGTVPSEDWTQVGWLLSSAARGAGHRVGVAGGAAAYLLPAANTVDRDIWGAGQRVDAGICVGEMRPRALPLHGEWVAGGHARPHPAAAALSSLLRRQKQRLGNVVVAWLLPCCGCCGFVNEAVPIISGLLGMGMDVRIATPIEGGCMCNGLPAGTLARLQQIRTNGAELRAAAADPAVAGVILVLHGVPPDYATFEERAEIAFPGAPGGGDGRPQGYFRIARAMYELTRLPPNYTSVLNAGYVDEVWTPSPFTSSVMRANGIAVPVRTVPEAVDCGFYHPLEHPLPLGLLPEASMIRSQRQYGAAGKRRFIFLSVFKWESRKGWDDLFLAYLRAFRGDSSVLLLVQTVPHRMAEAQRSAIQRGVHNVTRRSGVPAAEAPEWAILHHELPGQLMPSLYAAADAFVLPTRGEGWGLPILQALAAGLPVVATRWGGQMAFLRDENSYLVNVTEVEIPRNSYYAWEPGKRWGQSDVAHLAQLMRRVRAEPREAAAKAREGRRQAERFGVAAVAATWADRFTALRAVLLERRRGGADSATPTPNQF